MSDAVEDKRTAVLLIEDNESHVELVRKMLARSGGDRFEMKAVTTLKAGLKLAKDGKYKLILLDLTLPDSDSGESFRKLAGQVPDIPIIVLSGDDNEGLAIQLVQKGAQDYLVKGQMTHHWLTRAMHYALERKLVMQELQKANDNLEKRVSQRTAELLDINERLQSEVRERKRAEDALQESNRQLAEALEKLKETQRLIIQRERLHALSSMASGIAHDFNNALAPIVGFSELLLLRPDGLADQRKVREYLEMIHTAAKESARVVSRLREFYRYREPAESLAPVSLDDLIHQVISITQPRWKNQAMARGADIKIVTELQNVPTVYGNESELREMVTNLMMNAVDAIERSGRVIFRTFVSGKSVVLQVIDTGSGMSSEVLQHCLEPFYSTKSEHGTGLGLGIVYGTVRRHDGDVKIDSAEGRGTTVTISLPAYVDARAPEKSAPAVVNGESLNVLVVEDEPMVRELIDVYLREDGHRVETAANGREGLDKFRTGHFDLVLTDRAMPEMNGDLLAAEIKKIDPLQPVVLVTGFGDLISSPADKPSSVDLVVGKPFTLNSLRDAIVKVTRR
jgi:signal transduction histidine kinase